MVHSARSFHGILGTGLGEHAAKGPQTKRLSIWTGGGEQAPQDLSCRSWYGANTEKPA